MTINFPNPIYPTNALRFLDDLDKTAGPEDIADPAWQQTAKQARVKLDIIVVGAGLCGLSTAIALARSNHSVRVYEQAPEFGEVGAGIQIPPNSTRYLLAWGLGPHLEPHISEPFAINLRRWEDGSVIAKTKLRPEYRRNFGAPYFVIHRADYHSSLLARAREMGIHVESNASVQEYHFHPPGTTSHGQKPVSVTLRDGRTFSADLVVAADGVKSIARRAIIDDVANDKVIPKQIDKSAFRGTVDVSRMAADPDTAWLLETPNQNSWIGFNHHAMTYLIGGKNAPKRFNMVLSHSEPNDPSMWNQDNVFEEMMEHYKGWDPRLVKVMGMLDKVVKWPLLSGQVLERWIHESGRLVIIGDAAHAMVPYMSQGAAIAVEDAAALASALNLINDEAQLCQVLNVFEKVRMERATQMQQASLLNGDIWHLPDGPAQKARDESMRPEVEGKPFTYSANQWSDPTCQWWTYGYQADKVMETAWKKHTEQKVETHEVNGQLATVAH